MAVLSQLGGAAHLFKTAFITDAYTELGLGIVTRLAQIGWHIIAGHGNNGSAELNIIADRFPGQVTPIPIDIAQDDSVRSAAATAAGFVDHVDLLINNIDEMPLSQSGQIGNIQDYDKMLQLYETNALGPLRVVEAFLPLLDKGGMKRICFISSEAGSINACGATLSYGYHMSKAALNMGVKILFNRLRPEGYTFRLYSPGAANNYTPVRLDYGLAGVYAVEYFLQNRSFEPHDPAHSDENRLIMRDWQGCEWPW